MQKENILYIPGLLCTGDVFKYQIEHLKHDSVAYIANTTSGKSLHDMAQDILHNAPENFTMVSFSMGGYIALEILRQAKDRVNKACFMFTSARQDSDEAKENRRKLLAQVDIGKFIGVPRRLRSRLVSADKVDDNTIGDILHKMAMDIGKETFKEQIHLILERPDSRDDLTKYIMPTLIIGGRNDELIPLKRQYEMNDLMPNSRLAIIDNCGHTGSLEQPQAISALLRDLIYYY